MTDRRATFRPYSIDMTATSNPAATTQSAGLVLAHRFFLPIILLFFAYVLLQLASGGLIYFWKIGFDPARTIEYYFGSERMLEIFPGATDRFLQPRTFGGMLKITLGHFLGYGVLVFFLTHLARSLRGRPSPGLERGCTAFFIVALFEILSGLLILAIPADWIEAAPAVLTAARATVFFAFYGFCVGFLVLLVRSLSDPGESPRSRRRGLLLGLVGGCLVLSGCQSFATSYSIENYEGTGESVVRMSNNYLGGSFALPGKLAVYSAQLNLQKTRLVQANTAQAEPGGGAADSQQVVSFYGRFFDLDYVRIPAGPTLILTLDGRELPPFSGQGSAKLRRPYSEDAGEELVQEAAYWHNLSESVLVALYRAQSVRIRILGEKRELSFFATEKNRSNFRRFIRDELPEIYAAAREQ